MTEHLRTELVLDALGMRFFDGHPGRSRLFCTPTMALNALPGRSAQRLRKAGLHAVCTAALLGWRASSTTSTAAASRGGATRSTHVVADPRHARPLM